MRRSNLSSFRLLAGLFVACLVFAGCGGDDGDGGGEGGGGAAACGGEGGTELTLVSANFKFDPEDLAAPAGEQVTVDFTNEDDAPHTFTIEDLGCDTGTVDSGQSATLSFTMPEEETGFICTIHPDMTGRLTPE